MSKNELLEMISNLEVQLNEAEDKITMSTHLQVNNNLQSPFFTVQIVFNNLRHNCECGLRNHFRQRTKIWNHWFITTANGTTNWILKWTRLEFSSRTWFRIKGWDFTKWLLCNDYVIEFWNTKNRNWRNKRHEASNGMFTKRKCVFARRNWYSKSARKP